MSLPRGPDLLHDPRLNKSTAFTEAEREKLGLLGLLPEGIDDLDAQIRRAQVQLDAKTTDLERYIYLSQLQDTDETLFYRLLMSDPARFMPIVYTPTVGEACQKFGHLFRRPRGLYLSVKRKGRAREILRNWPAPVALDGLFVALRITGTRLGAQRFLFLGAGSAAIGVAELLVTAMTGEGLSREDARSRIALFDRQGLITTERGAMHDYQRQFAQHHAPIADLTGAIDALRPTGLIGLSTVGGAFDKRVIESMARVNERPMIFPYSNPTSRSECTAEQAYAWSGGRAVLASGSPFPPVRFGDNTFVPGQGNNVYIFPAIGMAVYATGARRVPDEMFIAAARGVAEQVTPADIAVGL